MRIGISCYPTIGGSGAVATELGKALARRGHQVHFIVTDIPFRLGQFDPNIYIHEMDTMTYPVLRTPPHDFTLAALMADIIERYQLQILHAHYALPFAVSAFLAKNMVSKDHDVKVVTTLHGTDVTVLAQDKSLYEVIKLGIEKSDAVTAVSNSLVQQTKDVFSISRDIDTIYNFIDTDLFQPRTASHIRNSFAPNDEKLLLHVSNFRQVKRIDDLVRMFKLVRNRVEARLLLVGEGPELNAIRDMVQSESLERDVFFLGNQDDVAPLFNAADLFCLPSQKESFGLVALEAMASGVPVIGSTAGGIPEVVQQGKSGFLAPVGDIRAMADYAVRLLQNPAEYQRMSAAARSRAVEEFQMESKVKEYESLYRRLIEHSHS
ncbi:N-acetyl-alpha-D-glucosaminyl L-malate synthase BshA [Alicyclobacillus sp. SO9]|uniref:N-acetyl-alpha-D-glucosaminyl L-malate synthase BshA n=1 Tax=Alicyclobacillus sp. SO9 TaxID=2665646 RepID=UPI0018E75DF6|nr:N-acetyl-alpha-D-glucosaminyl L-malate synthase BshA [Alicyclobacillus sp. SO9]QQE76783.1 N-acetyl-alpha-D-glucosaminyl L-malate synthase BshA [Alicyclobacillus sp. SO9]